MKIVVCPKDMALKPDMTIEQVEMKHIIHELAYPHATELIVYVDEDAGRFKILKSRDHVEFNGAVIDGIENLSNFV